MREEFPIACTLPADQREDREAEFRAMAALVRSAERITNGITVRFDPSPSLAAQLRDLTRRERACCPFFRFRLDESPAAVRLDVTVPPGAEPSLGRLFGPLVPEG